jgi:hypothetical protein
MNCLLTDNSCSSPARVQSKDHGAISAFVVLAMVAILALLGLVVDGGRALTAQEAATVEAEQAARAGAGGVSVGALRSGQVALDPQVAIAHAEAYTVAAGHPGTATVSGGVVTVTISYRLPTTMLGMVGISSLPVSATASAVDLHGVTKED